MLVRIAFWWQLINAESAQESALLRLAERQAGREEELAQAQQQAKEAEVRSEDLEQDVALLQQQVAALKEVGLLLQADVLLLLYKQCHGSCQDYRKGFVSTCARLQAAMV